ncbi:MAG: hypothetical protein IH968_13925 [Gemmatimonadetes bacterium]|nr:hypothetical protein [Gemmatimonadota bacterium]
MSIVRRTLIIAALALTAGCYRYVPADRTLVPAGAKVQARLTDAGVEEMRRYFGPNVRFVKGPLVSWDGEGLALLVETSVQREGFPPTILADTIRLLSHHVAEVGIQELNGKRTAGFTGVMLVGGAAAVLVARTFGGSSEGLGEGGEPRPPALILFSIPIRIGFRW